MPTFTTPTGKTLVGVSVDPHKFQAVSTLNQLEDYGLDRPSYVEGLKAIETRRDPNALAAKQLRDVTQRSFDKPRKLRAIVYSEYIRKVEQDHTLEGGVPAITLYLEKSGGINGDGSLVIPYGSACIAIDGETQTEARFILREGYPETGNHPVAVTVYHDVSANRAQQILHDYNTYPSPIPEKTLASLNRGGGLSKIVADSCQQANFSMSELNRHGAASTKKTVAAYTQVLAAAAGYALNGQALQRSANSFFKELNNPASGKVFDANAVPTIGLILDGLRTHPNRGKMNAAIWQVAGAVAASGRDPRTLDWDAAEAVYKQTAIRTQGGPRMPMATRLGKIAAAM